MKKIFFVFFIFTFSFNIFGAGYWGEGLSFSGGYQKTTTIKTPVEGTFTFRKTLDEDFITDTGISINDSFFNAATSVLLSPYTSKRFDFSIKNTFHYTKLFKTRSSENDYLCLGLFSLKSSNYENPLVFSLGYGFDYKRTKVISRRNNDINMQKLDHAFILDLRKRFKNVHEVYARLSSFDEYYYPEFCTPYYMLGYSFDVSKKFSVGAIGVVRYTDQFTLNGAMEGFQARLFASYKW